MVALLCASASAEARPRHTVELLDDNDFWVLAGQDRDLSNAMSLSLQLALPDRGGEWRLAGSIEQQLYTPPDLLETRLGALRLDRPYAAHVAGVGAVERVEGHLRARLGVVLGSTGAPALGELTQTAWHSTNRAPEPLGWPVAEVATALDLGARAELAYELRATDGAGRGVSATPALDAELGTLRRHGAASVLLGLGWLGAPGAAPAYARPAASSPDGRASLRVVAGVALRRVLQDDVQAGPVVSRGGQVPSWVELEPWVLERQLGVAAALGAWHLAATYLWRDAELSAPDATRRDTRLGRVLVGYSW